MNETHVEVHVGSSDELAKYIRALKPGDGAIKQLIGTDSAMIPILLHQRMFEHVGNARRRDPELVQEAD